MAKKIFPLYLDEELHLRFKEMYDNSKYNRHSFYSMFIDIAEKELLKFEREEEKK